MKRSLIIASLALLLAGCNRSQPAQQAEQQPVVQPQPVPQATPAPAVIQLAAFEQALAQHTGKLVLVDFTAVWCGPCKMMKPHLKRLAEENPTKLHILEVDVDDQRDVAQHFGVSAMPTLATFRNGQNLQHQVGYQNYDQLKAWLAPQLAQ
jgi:thioredoxin 1